MYELLVYFVSMTLNVYLVFKILRGINVEVMFKKDHIWEIKAFYIVASLISAHVLSSIILKFFEWGMLILK